MTIQLKKLQQHKEQKEQMNKSVHVAPKDSRPAQMPGISIIIYASELGQPA